MTQPTSDPLEPIDYHDPPPRTASRRLALYSTGLLATGFAMFVAVFLGSASSFEKDRTTWWAWPLAAAAAVAGAIFALSVRRRFSPMSAGAWTGVVLGLLLAGLCFGLG